MMRNRPAPDTRRPTALQRIERIHPHQMLLYLGVFGIVLVFGFLLTAFAASALSLAERPRIVMPFSFMASTVVIVASSYTLLRTFEAYDSEKPGKVAALLGVTLALGAAFCVLQFVGWRELNQNNVRLADPENPAGSFLFLISGVHLAHVAAGMFFLGFATWKSLAARAEPVKNLLFVTDPYERLRLRMLNFYWHAMDAIWIAIFSLFLAFS